MYQWVVITPKKIIGPQWPLKYMEKAKMQQEKLKLWKIG